MDSNMDSMIIENEMIVPVSIEFGEDFSREELDQLCRLCGNSSHQLMPIFSGDGNEHKLPDKIREHLPIIEVSKSDTLPLSMCYQCASTLISWHELYYACKEADQRLKELCARLNLRKSKSDEDLMDIHESSLENDDDIDSFETTELPREQGTPSKSEIIVPGELKEETTFDDTYNVSESFVEKTEESVTIETNNSTITESQLKKGAIERRNLLKKDLATSVKVVQSFDRRAPELTSYNPTSYSMNVGSSVPARRVDEFLIGALELKWRNENDAVESAAEDARTYVGVFLDDFSVSVCENRPAVIAQSNLPVNAIRYVTNANANFENRFQTTIDHRSVAAGETSGQTFGKPLEDVDSASLQRATLGERESSRPKKYELADLSKHLIHVDGAQYYKCDQCAYRCRYAAVFVRHRCGANRPMFKCAHCIKQYTTKKMLIRHIKTIHLHIRQFRCELCGKAFAERSHLKDHKPIHDAEPRFMCEVCGKRFRQYQSVLVHRQMHLEKKTFQCTYCEKAFQFRSKLLTHMKCHTGKNLFYCDVCGKAFTTKDYLRRHSRVHLRNVLYTCVVCQKMLKTRQSLQTHIKTSHIFPNADMPSSLLLSSS